MTLIRDENTIFELWDCDLLHRLAIKPAVSFAFK